MHAVTIDRCGGSQVLISGPTPDPIARPGEVLVRNRAIDVNYVDVYLRTGELYSVPTPFIPGKEAAGEVVAIGEGVTGFRPGQRVVYTEALGAYAELAAVPARLDLQGRAW